MQLIYKSFILSIVFILTCFMQTGFSQVVNFNYNYDSLSRLLPLQKTDTEKIKLLVLLADGAPEFSRQPPDILVAYLAQLIELNKRSRSINLEPYAKMHESYVQWQNKDYNNALTNLKIAVDLFDKQKKVIAPLITTVRTLYNILTKQEERLEFYKGKLAYYLLNGPVENTAACYHGIAGYYNYKADYNLAISNYLRAAAIFKPFWGYFYRNEIGVVGVTYERWGNDEKADYYLKMALPLCKSSGDSSNVAFCLGSLIALSVKQKKYDQALQYADECIGFTVKNANTSAPLIKPLFAPVNNGINLK